MVNFITVGYVPLYESSQPLRSHGRAKSCNSRNRGGQRARGGCGWASIIFHGQFFVRGRATGLPTSSFIPRPRRSLLADPVDRVHAWHLSSEIPLFRRETNENRPSRAFAASPFPLRSRCFHLPLPFLLANHLTATLGLLLGPLVLTCDLIRSFSRAALRLLNCLARCACVCVCLSAPSKFCTR